MFADDLARPLLIVGNGPSAAMPRYDLLPDDPVVFRMNWFFLEDRYHFGRNVDAFMYSIPNAELEARLATVINERWYDVRSICSPMRIPLGREGEQHRSPLYETGVPELDHWSLIAADPALARFMMSRPLPTQGMQALGAALQLGFRHITLCGIDMYESTESRYGFVIPESVTRALAAKDVAPGYEDAHSLDRDLDFLDACLARYPDARIEHIGPSRHLAARLPTPEPRAHPCTFDGLPAPEVQRQSKLTFVTDRAESDIEVQLSDELPYAEIDGLRCGFVTLVSGPFHHGARALARSLAKVSPVPLTVMCTPSADRSRLRASGLACVDVPEIRNPNALSRATERFATTYTKLQAFRMTHLDRAVYVDSDMIVLQSIDDLFTKEGFWAVPDHGIESHYDRFNSGLFVIEPDADLFDYLVDQIGRTHSYDHGDQGFLNELFPEWQHLPHAYNVNKRWSAHHPNLFHIESTTVLHFVGIKPWQLEPRSSYDELNRLWLSFLSGEELVELAEELRWRGAEEASRPTAKRSWVRGAVRRAMRRERKREPGSDWAQGTLLRRAQARTRDHAPAQALELLHDEWPGDVAATPGLHRELAKAYLLVGNVRAGLEALERGASMHPANSAIQRDLRPVRAAATLDRITGGLVPASVYRWIARSTAMARSGSR